MTSDMIAERPLPEITELTEPFWTAVKARRLEIQRCDDCGTYRFPPEYGCAACSSTKYTWTLGIRMFCMRRRINVVGVYGR